MSSTIQWEQQKTNHPPTYRYCRQSVRAAYGSHGQEGGLGCGPAWWTADDNEADTDQRFGDACDLLTARVAAEDAIRDLQNIRGEIPATPACCVKARKGDWEERAGGMLYCPTCGKTIAKFRQ
jgi:hypothetical protein